MDALLEGRSDNHACLHVHYTELQMQSLMSLSGPRIPLHALIDSRAVDGSLCMTWQTTVGTCEPAESIAFSGKVSLLDLELLCFIKPCKSAFTHLPLSLADVPALLT